MKSNSIKKWAAWASKWLLLLLVGFLIGVVAGKLLVNTDFLSLGSPFESGVKVFLVLVAVYCIGFLQVIIHELGHLVCGLLTGYKFSMFRIVSFALVKKDGVLQFKRYTLAGTGGQCLLSPPPADFDKNNGDCTIPVIWYNAGGSLFNILFGLLAVVLIFAGSFSPIVEVLLIIWGVLGIFSGLVNGIPLRMGDVENDGRNILSLLRSKDARRAFWIQMKINEELVAGKRLKEMPEEWFVLPEESKAENSIVASIGVFAENRLMDSQMFQEAEVLALRLLRQKTGIMGIYRYFLRLDRLYLELIGQGRRELLDAIYTKELKSFAKTMKNFPAVMRTMYAWELLGKEVPDRKKAEALRKNFEKIALTYPYAGDIESERALIHTVDRILLTE